MPVDYSEWDGTSTRLWYNSAGQLARISEDPPGTNTLDAIASITDIAYNTERRLWMVRDGFANDAMRMPTLTHVAVGDDTTATVVTYDGAGQVAHVVLPIPYDGTTGAQQPRPGHTYQYVNANTTRVHLDGFSGTANEPNGFNREVTFDLAGRMGTDADATSNVSEAPARASFAWDAADRPVVRTDAAGRATTTVYDGDATRAQSTGRVSDVYGPAPAACFATVTPYAPNGSCTSPPPPHTHTDFDAPDGTSATGLALVAWANTGFTGAPTTRAEAPGPSSSGLLGSMSAGPWSGRYTGEITLPAAGTYVYGVAATAGSARVFVDDTLVADSATGGTGVKLDDVVGRHRFRIDAVATGSSPAVTLTITPPADPARALVAADLHPRYANPTKTTTDDSLGVPARVNLTKYDSLANSVVKADVVDPAGLDLVTTSATETALLRRPTALTLPANDATAPDAVRPYGATVFDYYANTEAATNPCPGGGSANQGGRLKTTTTPSPDGTGSGRRATTVAYDAAGRVVSAQLGTGSEGLTCTTYDVRGRVLTVVYPQRTNANVSPAVVEAAHTTTYDHAVGGNPLVRTASDPAGTITTKVDLLGRVLSYTDVWSKTTTSTYDQAGRLTQTAGPAGTMVTTYTPAGRVRTQNLDGADVARATYAVPTGELASVSYPNDLLAGGNGSALAAVERHATGALTRLRWTGVAGSALADDVVSRSQSGKVVDESVDGTDADPAQANFVYDAAGRLTRAAVTAHVLDYAFASSGGCGTQTAAGRDTNRTSVVDNAGTPATYCYDQADRLTSGSDASVGTVTYDSHGNTATLGTQALLYDGGDRHTATRVGGAEVVRYARDATGRITSRTEGSAIVHYGSAGPTDSASFTMDAANAVTERTIGLLGGVLVTKRGGLLAVNDVWSYPNVHGDVMATASSVGVKQASFSYDPFGNGAAPDNSAGNFDYGWLGQHQRPLEHAGSLATIEMGARQYVPSIGRFLEVDPVEGGSCNAYDYACGDSVNGLDLNGLKKRQRDLPEDLEALGGDCHYSVPYAQLAGPYCSHYRAAVWEDDSSIFYDYVEKHIDYFAPQGPQGGECPGWAVGLAQFVGLGDVYRGVRDRNFDDISSSAKNTSLIALEGLPAIGVASVGTAVDFACSVP